jgi:HD-GYP domain-containing protein (c-di-GMP phosphodiesterase class II)
MQRRPEIPEIPTAKPFVHEIIDTRPRITQSAPLVGAAGPVGISSVLPKGSMASITSMRATEDTAPGKPELSSTRAPESTRQRTDTEEVPEKTAPSGPAPERAAEPQRQTGAAHAPEETASPTLPQPQKTGEIEDHSRPSLLPVEERTEQQIQNERIISRSEPGAELLTMGRTEAESLIFNQPVLKLNLPKPKTAASSQKLEGQLSEASQAMKPTQGFTQTSMPSYFQTSVFGRSAEDQPVRAVGHLVRDSRWSSEETKWNPAVGGFEAPRVAASAAFADLEKVIHPTGASSDSGSPRYTASFNIVEEIAKMDDSRGRERGRERDLASRRTTSAQEMQTHGAMEKDKSAVRYQKSAQEANVRQAGFAAAMEKLSRHMPLRYAENTVRNASTSIESILKKAYKDDWVSDANAANLVALVMKTSSKFTYDHCSRVVDLSLSLAEELGIKDERSRREIADGAMFHDIGEIGVGLGNAQESETRGVSEFIKSALTKGSFLHDIGKIKIPKEILYKPGRLTDEEYEILKQHPIIGEQIVRPIPSLRHCMPTIRHHHERWDGRGYPDGLKGEDIPVSARIISIVDVYDALVSERPYKKGMPKDEALRIIRQGAGTQFDPTLVEAFAKIVESRS